MVNAAEAYKRQQVLTATPEALTLMLYNGALRFMTEGREAIEKKDYEEANNSLQKAQNIITEFRVTLNMEYEIAHQLLPLYNYVYDRLVEANMKSDIKQLDEAKTIITDSRGQHKDLVSKKRLAEAKAAAQEVEARPADPHEDEDFDFETAELQRVLVPRQDPEDEEFDRFNVY